MLRNNNKVFTIHDEILIELFNLNRENIKFKMEYGIGYLYNSYRGKRSEVGFIVKLSSNEITAFMNNKITINDLLDKYADYILLSNEEKYLLMILFDNYIISKDNVIISLSKIEKDYRSKCTKNRNVVINNKTFNKYYLLINSLSKKTIYVKTNCDFRKKGYGVNNNDFEQQLLSINSIERIGAKDLSINYSLGLYGKIIKNSKRYSTMIPKPLYYLNLNQMKKFLVGVFIARHIFVGRKSILNPLGNGLYTEFDIDKVYEFVSDRTLLIKSNFNRYREYILETTLVILEMIKNQGEIYDYENNLGVIRILYREPPQSYYST